MWRTQTQSPPAFLHSYYWSSALIFQTYELFEIPHATSSNIQTSYAVTAYYNIYIHFNNNHAQIAGSTVYGGAMDIFHIRVDYESTNRIGFSFLTMNDVLNNY